MQISVLGIVLGKNSWSIVGLDEAGKVVVRHRMRRETVIAFAAKLPGCVVAMEACCGAHHMGRVLARIHFGHQPMLEPGKQAAEVARQRSDQAERDAATFRPF